MRRYLPLGDGQFLALTDELRGRLEELAAFVQLVVVDERVVDVVVGPAELDALVLEGGAAVPQRAAAAERRAPGAGGATADRGPR